MSWHIWVVSALVAVQVLDVVLHIVVGQLEPLRIVAGAIILGAAFASVARPNRAGVIKLAGLLAYLALNAVFLVNFGLSNPVTGGPRVAFFLFVGATVLLATLSGQRRI